MRLILIFTLLAFQSNTADATCGLPHYLGQPKPALAKSNKVTFLTKQLRFSLGMTENNAVSENFALHWGTLPLSEDEVSTMLASAEEALEKFEAMGLPTITGSNEYLINIYVVPTAEDIGGAAGVAWVDSEGYPFMRVNGNLFDTSPGYMEHTIPHELMHLIQLSTNADFNFGSGWLWESTAETATAAVLPEDDFYFAFYGPFAVTPEYPLTSYRFDLADDNPAGSRHYGAGIYFQHLIENENVDELLFRLWSAETIPSSPTDHISSILDEDGLMFDKTVARFAAHQAFYDITNGDELQRRALAYAAATPAYENLSTAFLSSQIGTFFEVTQKTPQRLGYNTIGLEVGVEPRRYLWDGPTGAQATLVVKRFDDITYHPFQESASGAWYADYEFQGDELAMAISVVNLSVVGAARYSIEVAAAGSVPPKSSEPDTSLVVAGGGCNSREETLPSALLLLLILLGLKRGFASNVG